MEYNKICKECKKEFITNRTKSKYCSHYCRDKNRRKRYKDTNKRLQKEWEIKNHDKRLTYQRDWERKNRAKRLLKTQKWIKKNPHYHRDYHHRDYVIIREKRYKKIPRVKYKIYIRGLTNRKFGKLEKGFVYHHNTEPYQFDKFIILEKGLHKWMHEHPKSFKVGGLVH
jgi:hypothetical protein